MIESSNREEGSKRCRDLFLEMLLLDGDTFPCNDVQENLVLVLARDFLAKQFDISPSE
jgi:hypothetical protein